MRSLFIVGGTGQIGRAAALNFLAHGWRVTVGHRGLQPLPKILRAAGVEEAIFDREQEGALAQALGDGADALLDCVAFTKDHGQQLVEVSGQLGAILAVSSASVYRDQAGRSLDEARQTGFPEFPVPIPETHPTVDPGSETYSTKKIAVERVLLDEAKAPVTILRPCAVHGPGSTHPREWWFVKRALDGRGSVPVSYDGLSRFHTTATQNLAEACRICADAGGRRVVNVGDPDPPTVAEMGAAIGSAMGRPFEIVLFPGPPRRMVGASPWSIPKPIVVDMGVAELLVIGP